MEQDDIGFEADIRDIKEAVQLIPDIKRLVKRQVVDIDYYDVDNGSAGYVDLSRRLRYPAVITHIATLWDTAATAVTITIGDRVITPAIALGFLNIEGRFQISPRDVIKIETTPSKFCYLEIMGYADNRKMEE